MKPAKAKNATVPAKGLLSEARKPQYELRLYVAGMTPRSVLAIDNIRVLGYEPILVARLTGVEPVIF
jgi:hypothetical protein